MPEPEDTINTPAGTGDEVVDTQETAPASTDTNTPAGTEVAEGAETTTTEEGGQDSDFLSPETRKAMDEQLAKNPDLKPNFDYLRKQLQGDYTRKRQQESQKIKDLEARAAIADRIQGDPELVKVIQQYKAGGLKQDAPKKEAVADVLEEVTKDFSPEENMLFMRLKPAMEKMIGQMIDPLQKATAQTEEQAALTQLSNDAAYAEIPVNEYWDEAKAAKTKYPGMNWTEAFNFAIGQDFKVVAPQLKKFGEDDALKKNTKTEPARKKAGFVAGGNGTGADVTANTEDLEGLSAEETRKKLGLKIVG